MDGHPQSGVLFLLSGVLRRVRSATGPHVKSTTPCGLRSQRLRGRRARSIKCRPRRPLGLFSHRDDAAGERSMMTKSTPARWKTKSENRRVKSLPPLKASHRAQHRNSLIVQDLLSQRVRSHLVKDIMLRP